MTVTATKARRSSLSPTLDRCRKIADAEHVAAVRKAGWAIRVHGWAKVRGRWTLTRDIDVS